MKKIVFIILMVSVICTLLTACDTSDSTQQPVKTQMVSPEQPLRQYKLENATDRQKAERMLSVTLYEDGKAGFATPPISSYAMVGTYYYALENGELLIFEEKGSPIAVFDAPDDKTIIFKSATVPLFADAGARYVRTTNTVCQIKDLPAGELEWESYDFLGRC